MFLALLVTVVVRFTDPPERFKASIISTNIQFTGQIIQHCVGRLMSAWICGEIAKSAVNSRYSLQASKAPFVSFSGPLLMIILCKSDSVLSKPYLIPAHAIRFLYRLSMDFSNCGSGRKSKTKVMFIGILANPGNNPPLVKIKQVIWSTELPCEN